MDKFKPFEKWLIEKQDISRSARVIGMEIIEKALEVKDFEKIKSLSILKRLFTEYKTKRSFTIRNKVEKTNIVGSFALYLLYVESQQKPVVEKADEVAASAN